MSSLVSALDWYHKKIGAYDKQLWEKSVDQRILRGVCAIPKKTARIKTELIDVDLVRGSAFAKAKPQHSWIAATISGFKRVLLLPLYYSWWQVQTNSLVTCTLVLLYFVQIAAMYFYFSADDKEFSEVSVCEILTPVVMMFILGILHSQIVATFTSKKSRKQVTRAKRRRIKSKRLKSSADYDRESKSSPDSASDDKMENMENSNPSQTANESCDEIHSPKNNIEGNTNIADIECEPCGCKRYFKTGQQLRFTFQDSSKDMTSDRIDTENSNLVLSSEEQAVSNTSSETHIMHLAQSKTQASHSEDFNELIQPEKVLVSGAMKCMCHRKLIPTDKTEVEASNCELSKDSNGTLPNHEIIQNKDKGNVSSDEDYFVAKKPLYTSEQWKRYVMEMKSNCNAFKLCSKNNSVKTGQSILSRRYSDVGPIYKNAKIFQTVHNIHQGHRHSADSILVKRNSLKNSTFSSDLNLCTKDEPTSKKSALKDNKVRWNQRCVPPSITLPINIKNFSSSCESGAETTSPNTPSKPLTSDLEWPLITNTDCNSDSTDCSSQCSEDNGSEVSPSENPFAWEIQEPSKKFSNVGYTGTDKGHRPRLVSCTIWERNECKKADLTALDISSAIIQKVDSSQHSTEYIYIGVLFAFILSSLPLLFRLQCGVAEYIFQDMTSDVLALTMPTSEEVAKITGGLLDVMFGPEFRVKIVVFAVMLERFTLSLAYFFLLSVAEKTFKQRFLYAKHFCYLTSSRRAKRSDLPHFRLNKVRNIKIWLSIRSYMKKLGPQRSVDVIVSITFILEVCVISFLCIQLLKETGHFADRLYCWELLFWTLALGIYLLRFMIIGSKINKKYRNLSVLITEQINLYLHMEQKPHKKEELILANNVLKLAADLLKELESPFKISGLCANSYLYNITKVVVLSAFSAVLTDVLGFKLKLYKIKIK
ncbi:protein PHTF2-like [Uloborus diversus]|uniref:protein PHTF2-like n=1 Tax=Uloborus diversus TaxID=327109 RepID=UPI00240A4673|nr:protein PHTF2-like [Uloborus diversus]XP_054712329.1 protein PHTF2-like [Uloborus diversus]